MKKQHLVYTALAISLLAGCTGNSTKGQDEDGPKGGNEPISAPNPVKLTAAIDGIIIDEAFNSLITAQLKEKSPHITLDIIQPTAGNKIADMVTAGAIPDLVFTYNGKLLSYVEQKLVYDMRPDLKKQGIDLATFEQGYLDDITRMASKNGELFGLPINVNYHALYYNKDIFDKFGVAYPKDGMTWEELIVLAKKVTRTDTGIQYRGLDPGLGITWMSQPLSVRVEDPVKDVPAIQTKEWKRAFELSKEILTIPGNETVTEAPKNQFIKSRSLAMLLELNILTELSDAAKSGLNWDVVQYPSYTEKPNVYGNSSVNMVVVTPTSKNKEAAVQVVKILTGNDLQLAMTKEGKVSPLASPTVKAAFASGIDLLKGKNLSGIFKSKPVSYPIPSKYNGTAIVNARFKDYVSGTTDVNSALRQADEEMAKLIAAEEVKGN